MSKLQGEKAQRFIAWLACVKGFLPSSMTIEEASTIFLRRDEEKEQEKKTISKKNINSHDRHEVLELMKIIYGNKEVKDDKEIADSHGKPRTTSVSEMAESPSCFERLLLQK